MLPQDDNPQDLSEFNDANCCMAGGESVNNLDLQDLVVESKHKSSFDVDRAIDSALDNF
jgi:hypothetical protein